MKLMYREEGLWKSDKKSPINQADKNNPALIKFRYIYPFD